MDFARQELDAPTKLVGFVIGIAFVFLAALFVGDKIGPDVPAPVASHTDHDSHDAAAVHTAEFIIEVQEGQA